jgi:hypothetical protein
MKMLLIYGLMALRDKLAKQQAEAN